MQPREWSTRCQIYFRRRQTGHPPRTKTPCFVPVLGTSSLRPAQEITLNELLYSSQNQNTEHEIHSLAAATKIRVRKAYFQAEWISLPLFGRQELCRLQKPQHSLPRRTDSKIMKWNSLRRVLALTVKHLEGNRRVDQEC